MIQVDTIKVTLPLRQKFAVSKGATSAKTNLIAILNNRYSGEASTSVYYGPSLAEVESSLQRGVQLLKRKRKVSLKTLEEINACDIHPIARSALIGAVLNYISGETRRYPWEVLSLGTPVGIKSSMTISLGDPSSVAEAIAQSEYPILKVKMGNESDQRLIELLESVTDKEIRVDANGAWSCEKAEEMIFYLAKVGIRVIEQPTDIAFAKEWPHLKGKNAVELILDEGLNTVEDYEACKEYIDGVNIKMEKSGGILEAIQIARRVRKDEKKIMLGCMVESSVGIAQSIYMSSLADYHDLDAPQLLEDDIALGIRYDRESIEVDREIIGGPKLRRDIIEKYASD